MGDPWAGQERDKDIDDFEWIWDSLDSWVTFGADPPIGSEERINWQYFNT